MLHISIKLAYILSLLQSSYHTLESLPAPAFITRLKYGSAPLERSPRKASFHSLPNEITLKIFAFLELKPYITCYGVCKDWRELLPFTQMHPIRKRLFAFYRCILDTPDFDKASEWTDKNLQQFDREEYIRCLRTQYPAIPDEFRMWILEWPSRLAVQCTWPGLPFIHCCDLAPISRQTGVNWIAYRSFSPQLSSLVYKRKTPSEMFIPGLLIWREATGADWLVFEKDEPDLFGRVFRIDAHFHNMGSIPYYPPQEHVEHGDDEDTESDSDYPDEEEKPIIYEDWIYYLDRLWFETSRFIRSPRTVCHFPDPPIPLPVVYKFNGQEDQTLPAPAWSTSS